MKIVYDYQWFSRPGYSGIARYFVELATRLMSYRDTSVRIVSPLMQSACAVKDGKRAAVFGLDVSKGPRLPVRAVLEVNSVLFRLLAGAFSPDIVHETYYGESRTAPSSAKIVTTIHDTIPERLSGMFPNRAEIRSQRLAALRRADRVICVSRSTRKDLLELYDVDPSRVSVIALGSSIKSSNEPPIVLDCPYFLHVGARREYKNFNRLIQAMAISKLYSTHYLVSFSDVPFKATELQVMDEAGIPRSRIIGRSGNDELLARYYAGALAFVFPSLYEGFGIPLLEAMECGCPIIASETSSMPEVGGDAGVYFNPSDVESIADALATVAGNSELRARLIALGSQRHRLFSWDRCAAETYAVYEEALHGSETVVTCS